MALFFPVLTRNKKLPQSWAESKPAQPAQPALPENIDDKQQQKQTPRELPTANQSCHWLLWELELLDLSERYLNLHLQPAPNIM